MSKKYCDADKRECEIYLSGIYNLNCRRCGYLRALADAVEKLKKMNVFYLAVDDESEFPVIYQKDAIAAIKALLEGK